MSNVSVHLAPNYKCDGCGALFTKPPVVVVSPAAWESIRDSSENLICVTCQRERINSVVVPVDHMATRNELALEVEQLVTDLVVAKKSIVDAEDALESLGRPEGEYLAKGIEALARQLAELRIVNVQLNATLDVIRRQNTQLNSTFDVIREVLQT